MKEAHKPKVSIVIPCYFAEATIRRAIDSILAQTEPDFEVIVVNDGSTDASLDILATYDDPRLRVFSQENQGEGGARNRGIREARGEFLTFLDDDDEFAADRLEQGLALMKRHPSAGACVLSYHVIAQKGGEPRYSRDLPRLAQLRMGLFDGRTCEDSLQFYVQLGATLPFMTLMPRTLALELDGFWVDSRTRHGVDADFFLRLLICHPVAFGEASGGTYHLEASRITATKQLRLPAPFMLHPERVLSLVGEDRKAFVREILAHRAIDRARHLSLWGKGQEARRILHEFSCFGVDRRKALKSWAWSFIAPLATFLRPLYYGLKKALGEAAPTRLPPKEER